jgi:hypothetical protein
MTLYRRPAVTAELCLTLLAALDRTRVQDAATADLPLVRIVRTATPPARLVALTTGWTFSSQLSWVTLFQYDNGGPRRQQPATLDSA